MRKGSYATMVVLLLVACERVQEKLPGLPKPHVPRTHATVVTVRTTLQPANRSTTHAIVIGENLARATDEAGLWRLIDFQRNRITFVDDVERTYRVVPLSELVGARRSKHRREAIPAHPRASYTLTDDRETVLGVTARRVSVRMGKYERELWFATHPRIPSNLFALMQASEDRPSAFNQVARDVDEGLLAARGFPLLDHAELPYGKEMMVVDRNVVSIEQRDVPRNLLEIPRGYREVTEPDENRPPASSLPRDQKAPEAELPPSATDQIVP